MASFTGVSVVTGGKNCITSAIDANTDIGYHLLVVKDYSRTIQDIPNAKSILSGPFMVGGHNWCIGYYPNGEEPSSSEYFSLDLYLDEDDVGEAVEAKFQFSFVDQVEKQKPQEIFATETCKFTVKDHSWGSGKFMKRDAFEQSAHLKADCFTIRCDIMVCNDLNNSGTMFDIGQQFNNLLLNKVGADVTFEVSGKIFIAHRCVLAARSAVFMAQLFGPRKKGTTTSIIQIKDMEAKVFAALLSFIYTDSFPEMEEDNNMKEQEEQDEDEAEQEVMWLQDLLVAAERYDIQQLKFLCEKQLTENICVSSVASTLALAEQHNCRRLKEACLKFTQVQSPRCLEKVMATDGWEHIRMTYPSLLKEFVAKVASNQKKVASNQKNKKRSKRRCNA